MISPPLGQLCPSPKDHIEEELMSQLELEKVFSMLFSRLDYRNTASTYIRKIFIKKLQFVQNAAARVLTKTKSGPYNSSSKIFTLPSCLSQNRF